MAANSEILCLPSEGQPLSSDTQIALHGVTRVLASVGRAFVCLDADFRIVHASYLLDGLLGEGVARDLVGRGIDELLGSELFGTKGSLRNALLEGQRREGWRATLQFKDTASRLVSITTAPLPDESAEICDPRMRYVILLRPAEEDEMCSTAPAFYSGAIASSSAMQRIFRLVETLQHSEAAVLITGESGTGKEVVARAIHQSSPRSNGPFIAVNCGALPAELLESELFGHVRGAFTGAVRDRVGRFELASHGTLFLDEIGELHPHLQVKLLRVLQERQFERVGESVTRTARARIISATNVDLRLALRQGRLREDLFYRLCVVPIEVPPLRERREDISPLARHLLNRVTAQHGLIRRISPQAMRLLLEYSWPGNVRELANVMEYAVAVARMETILPEDLPEEIRAPLAFPRRLSGEHRASSSPSLHPAEEPSGEAMRLAALLESHHWNRSEVARALGLSRTTLWRKMRELRVTEHS
ncbi:MAG: sigma-54-dependent Fis family transcriptional regulator, partial [Acidobacteriota bacterium]|nr:sigma-54-dependent Fis family transcriptional regulator [Acidobacteriota bacterium]